MAKFVDESSTQIEISNPVDKNKGLLNAVSGVFEKYDNEDLKTTWYSADQISSFLLKSLPKNSEASSPITIKHDDKNPLSLSKDSKKSLEVGIKNAKENLENGISTLIPINLNGNHWTGGVMKPGQNGKNPQFIYNDPLGHEMPEELRKAIGDKFEIIDLKTQQQKNGYDCGPFTAENLLKISTFGKESEEEMRKSLKQLSNNGNALFLRLDHAKKFPDLFGKKPADLPQETLEKFSSVQSEMKNLFESFENQGRLNKEQDGKKIITVSSPEEAESTADKIKKAYEELGIKCDLTEEDNRFKLKIHMPKGFEGKDPFTMKPDELAILQQAIAENKQEVKKTKTDENKSSQASETGNYSSNNIPNYSTKQNTATTSQR
jgi:hypothetical protein